MKAESVEVIVVQKIKCGFAWKGYRLVTHHCVAPMGHKVDVPHKCECGAKK